jgi:hypothetical protein
VNQPFRIPSSARPGIAAAALLLFAWTGAVGGRQQSLAHDLLSTPDQLEALRQAWNNGLSFIPGEVLVRFRDDVTTAQQARAMSEMRTQIDTGTNRLGGAMLMKSVDEPDARQLASTLKPARRSSGRSRTTSAVSPPSPTIRDTRGRGTLT